MTIHVSEDAENSINAAVRDGRFPSADVMVTELVREYAQRTQPQSTNGEEALAGQGLDPDEKPIWEEILELVADVPQEEWDKLPTDLAEQHDHYIYGIPKRPVT